jgi:hypothetical protein
MSDPAEHLHEHERKFYDTLKNAVGTDGQSHALFIVLITFENLSKERGLRKAAEEQVEKLSAEVARRATRKRRSS